MADQQTPSQKLADYTAAYSYDSIPVAVRERAKYLMLDAIGIAYASTRYPFAHHILSGIRSIAGTGAHGLIGLADKLPLRDAVLMNAALVHGLDYDDTHVGAIVHPTASALPCAMGVAEAINASGRDLLAAYILGVETVVRVCGAAKGGFHHFGFHPTGIAAHFSCALQAGWLYGLNARQLTMAQGLVGSTAAASQEFLEEGAWNKRLHPGWAGVAGITAAHLARNGYIGPSKTYEGRFGLYQTHLQEQKDQVDYAYLTAGLGELWETSVVAIKPYPVCHLIHACADAALVLREKHNLKPEDIASVQALVPEPTIHIIAQPEANKIKPVSDYDAKFSVQFVTAACLALGRFGLAELEQETLNNPAILDLAARVSYAADPDATYPKYFSGGVLIKTKDGRTLKHHEPVNRGAGERALTGDEISRKYRENAAMALPARRVEQVRDAVLNLEAMSAREIVAVLAAR
jgi:2-methylcitrate dehydratase PrpD